MRLPLPLAAALAATLGAGLSGPAAAQVHCAPRDVMVERLSDRFGESLEGGGLQSEVAVFEVWTSAADGSWTILMTRADGVSCVMAAGTDWLKARAEAVPDGLPS